MRWWAVVLVLPIGGCSTLSTSFTGHCVMSRDTLFGVGIREKGLCTELSYDSALANFQFMELINSVTHGPMYDVMGIGDGVEDDPRFTLESGEETINE